MIEASSLEFSYREGGFSLRLPKWTVVAGETVAVIGPSGIGKTTLLHLVAGILSPRQGQVRVHEQEISALTDAERRDFRIRNIGLVFQEFELLEYLTVLDNVLLPYRLSKALKLEPATLDRARDLANRVGIFDKLNRYPRKLSQGERQRAALCRALLPKPPLLLADEPTGNLDPLNQSKVIETVFEYVREQRATLVAVTHERDLLQQFGRVEDAGQWQTGSDSQIKRGHAPGGNR
jgi:ABC-type lipoprotein export system ATPase subunit